MSFENTPKPRPEHISQSSPEYRENREEVFNHSFSSVFGEVELMKIEGLRKSLKDVESRISTKKKIKASMDTEDLIVKEMEDVIHKTFDILRKKLKDVLRSKDNDIIPFLKECLDIPEIAERLQKDEEIPFQTSEYPEESRMGTFIMKDRLDNADMEKVIKRHIDIYYKRSEKLDKILPEMFARFRDSVLEAIKQKYLPITEELLESRIGTTKIVMSDPLLMKWDTSGNHDSFSGTIEISPYLQTIEEVEHVIFHELTHAISGRTIIMNNEKEDIMVDIDHQRIGFAFRKVHKDGKSAPKKLRWLNEAVTEDIAVHLTGRDVGVYKKERSKLQDLFDKGLSRDILYNAYFENYEPDSEDKVPAWKEFTKEINKLYPGIGIQELIKMQDSL